MPRPGPDMRRGPVSVWADSRSAVVKPGMRLDEPRPVSSHTRPELDYRTAVDLAPIGLVLSRRLRNTCANTGSRRTNGVQLSWTRRECNSEALVNVLQALAAPADLATALDCATA